MDAQFPLTLWFSRLVLTTPMQNSHALHAALWKGYAATTRPFLFRADPVHGDDGRFKCLKVLVQSTATADWSRLADIVEHHQVQHTWTFAVGQRFRFYLRANATRAVKGRSEPSFKELDATAFRARRGVRVPVRGYEEQLAWLKRQGTVRAVEHQRTPRESGEIVTTGGFAIAELARENADPVAEMQSQRRIRLHGIKRVEARPAQRLLHEGVDLEGILEVTDPAVFATTVTLGMGKGRAFGFGLLSLAAPSERA